MRWIWTCRMESLHVHPREWRGTRETNRLVRQSHHSCTHRDDGGTILIIHASHYVCPQAPESEASRCIVTASRHPVTCPGGAANHTNHHRVEPRHPNDREHPTLHDGLHRRRPYATRSGAPAASSCWRRASQATRRHSRCVPMIKPTISVRVTSLVGRNAVSDPLCMTAMRSDTANTCSSV